MGATADRSQKIKFYYGNAAVDLAHLLPKDDAAPASQEMSEINRSLDQALACMAEIQDSRKKLSYLIADLKRILN